MPLPNIFSNLINRILPGSVRVRYFNTRTIQPFTRYQNYWQENSIYVQNIINKISNDVAMLRFRHVRITRIDGAPDDMQIFETDPLATVLTISPNDYKVPFVFWSEVMRKILLDQIAVVVPTYTGGNISGITLADGVYSFDNHQITIEINGTAKTVDINSVWIFENPRQNVNIELGMITGLIDASLRALSYKLAEGNNRLKGFLKIPTKAIDEKLRKEAELRVNNIMAAAAGSGIGYLQQGEEFQELTGEYGTASQDQMEFLKSVLHDAYGISPKLFTCEYTEDEFRAYYSTVLKPYMRMITEEINRKYFSQTARTQGHKLITHFDIFDMVTIKDMTDFAFKSKYSAVLNSNEIRELMGFPPYYGGDAFQSNLNATNVGAMDPTVMENNPGNNN